MTKYYPEYIQERMDDFIAFRKELRNQGYMFSESGEILLYRQFRKE